MTYDEKKRFIINILYIIVVCAVILFIFKYVLVWLLPFILGLLIASMLRPVAKGISFITTIKSKAIIFFVLTAFYAGVGILIWLAVISLIAQATYFIGTWPEIYSGYIQPIFVDFSDWLTPIINRMSPDAAEAMSGGFASIISQLAAMVGDLSTSILGYVTSMMKNIPIYLITLIFTIVSSVFISLNYANVVGFLIKQLPEKGKEIVREGKEFLSIKLVKMFKAYMIIMGITFTEVAIGLTLLRIDAAMNIGALVAIFDILPFLGSGGILVPWAIFELVTGDIYLGTGILIIYILVTVVRNFAEPKIVGQQIGLHPIVTITAMYAGLRIFGFAGFIGAPLTALFIKHLQDSGKIRIWK